MFGDTIKGTLRTLSSCYVTMYQDRTPRQSVCTDSVLVISPNGSNYAAGRTVQGSILGRANRFFSCPKFSDVLQGPLSLVSEGTVFFTRQSGCGEKSSAHFRPMPRLRKSGSVPLLPLHKSHVFKRGSTTILPALTPSFSGSLSRAVV